MVAVVVVTEWSVVVVVAAGTHTKPSHLATFNKVQNPLHLTRNTASEVSSGPGVGCF